MDRAALQVAFAAFGHRPQFFMAGMGAVLSPLPGRNGRFEPALQQAAQDQQAQDEAQMEWCRWVPAGIIAAPMFL